MSTRLFVNHRSICLSTGPEDEPKKKRKTRGRSGHTAASAAVERHGNDGRRSGNSRPMQLHETGAEQHVGKRSGGRALLALSVHHVHTGADIAVRVLHSVQRDPAAVGAVDPTAAVTHPLHQSQSGWHRPVHVVPAGSQLHPQQPVARRLPGVPDGHVHQSEPGGATARGHCHHRGPSHHVGVQPLHRHSAAAPLPSHRHARHSHCVHVLPVDATAVVPVCLLQYDTLPGVSVAAV